MTEMDKIRESQARALEESTIDPKTFELLCSHFDQDLSNFWNKANFYLAVNTGLFSAFLIGFSSLDKSTIGFLVPILGIGIGVLWFQVLDGTVFFIGKWREQIIKSNVKCFSDIETSVQEAQNYRDPQTVTRVVPFMFMAAWFVTLLVRIVETHYYLFETVGIATVAFAIVFCFLLNQLIDTNSKLNPKKIATKGEGEFASG
jgi:hypothetical protein